MEQTFCKDCKNYRKPLEEPAAVYIGSVLHQCWAQASLVTGERQMQDAEVMREHDGKCGPKATLWLPK